jgi:asparaginyl-tRNA synthetase
MDILAPGIGEIVGGSQREERLEMLEERMRAMHIPVEEMSWYLDTRRFGTVPHAGFGLGFERMVQFVTGMTNIRDVIPFARTPRNCEF